MGYQPDAEDAYPSVVHLDGWSYAYLMPTFTILDNLIVAQAIPPAVAVMPDSLKVKDRMRELVYHPPFNQFLVSELMPWARSHYRITDDLQQVAIGGASAGGLAAAFAGLEHPQVFGNVLSQSGAFTLRPDGASEPGWIVRQFAEREKLPVKFHLDAGILEVNSYLVTGKGPTPLESNRYLRDTLIEKGYAVHYAEFSGGHDNLSWQGTLGDVLTYLLGKQA